VAVIGGGVAPSARVGCDVAPTAGVEVGDGVDPQPTMSKAEAIARAVFGNEPPSQAVKDANPRDRAGA
jgi:hypothetical protein